MTTENTTLSSTPSIAWREIPYARKAAIKAYLKELALQIRLYRRASRQSQSNKARLNTSEGFISGPKNHPLTTVINVETDFQGAPVTYKSKGIPVLPLLASINIDAAYSIYRHLHVATSMARGKSLLQIEPVGKSGVRKPSTPALDPEALEWANSVLAGTAKLYIIVRPELTPGQRIAQACHAVAAFSEAFPYAPWLNGTIIIKTSDESKHSMQFEYLRRGLRYFPGLSMVYADSDLPELGISALAFYGPVGASSLRAAIKELPLA